MAWRSAPDLPRVLARHLVLPFLAIFLADLFASVYAWRGLFQVYSNEEYVDMAYAKGNSSQRVDRQYIMRPALPALLTSFALLLVVLWQEIIALEYFFNVQGLGRLFVSALSAFDTPMIVAIVTTFAYLIAITVFILDICYVFVDPRVRLGSEQQQGGAVRPAAAGGGATHIVIAPLAVLFLTGFAFAMVGIALERVFEPRLRES